MIPATSTNDGEAPTASSHAKARRKRRPLRSLKQAMAARIRRAKRRSRNFDSGNNDEEALPSHARAQQENCSVGPKTGPPVAAPSKLCLLDSMLPLELRIQIYSHLAAVEVDKGIGAVNRVFRKEIESSLALWKEYCQRTGKLRLPLIVRRRNHAGRINNCHHNNPYLRHYHQLPCVPHDFPSMESALLTVMFGEKKIRNRKERHRFGKGKVVIATYFAHKKGLIFFHRCSSSSQSPSSQNGRKNETEIRLNFARGSVVSQAKARRYWMKDNSELESLINMHSRIVRVVATGGGGGGGKAGNDDGLWMYCRMF